MPDKIELGAEILLSLYVSLLTGHADQSTLNIHPDLTNHIGIEQVQDGIITLPQTYQNDSLFIKEINDDGLLKSINSFNIIPATNRSYSLNSLREGDRIRLNSESGSADYLFVNYDNSFLYYKDGNGDIGVLDPKQQSLSLVFKEKIEDSSHIKLPNSISEAFVSYNFRGISWQPRYSMILALDENKGYLDYNINIKNNTDADFNDYNINLHTESLSSVRAMQSVNRATMFDARAMSESATADVSATENNTNFRKSINIKNQDLYAGQDTVISYMSEVPFRYETVKVFNITDLENTLHKPTVKIKVDNTEGNIFRDIISGQMKVFDSSLNVLTELRFNDGMAVNDTVDFNIGLDHVNQYSVSVNEINVDNVETVKYKEREGDDQVREVYIEFKSINIESDTEGGYEKEISFVNYNNHNYRENVMVVIDDSVDFNDLLKNFFEQNDSKSSGSVVYESNLNGFVRYLERNNYATSSALIKDDNVNIIKMYF